MSMLSLYFFTVLSKFSGVLIFMIIFSCTGILAFSLHFSLCCDSFSSPEQNEKTNKMVKKWNMVFIKIISVCLILYLFIPSIKETAFIYIVGKVSQNENINQIPDKAIKILNIELDKYIQGFEKK